MSRLFNQEGKRTIAQPSIESKLIYNRISQCKEGEIVTYEELDQLIGRSVQKTCRYALTSARNACMNDHRIVFSAIPNVGIKRLKNEEIPGTADSRFLHIKRVANKGLRESACVDYDNLTPENKIKHNTNISMFAVHKELAKPGSEKLIENQVKIDHQALPIGKVLRLFQE